MTAPRSTLPDAPKVELESVSEARHGEGGFLYLRRTQLVRVQKGTRSEPFPYDVIGRRALDASVIVAHHSDEEGRVHVWLRSSLRPPLALRDPDAKPGSQAEAAVLWEVPAGLIEPGESPRAGATRELEEELGFAVVKEAMLDLGPPSFPAPALLGEIHHFFHVEVEPARRGEPAGDGSPVEAAATILSIPLEEALAACRTGQIRDEKTELGLRRLAEVLGHE